MMYYPDFFSQRTADVSPRSSPLRTVSRGGTFPLASLSGDERWETSAVRRLRFFQTWHKFQSYIGHSKTAIKRWGDRACFRPVYLLSLLIFSYLRGNIAKTMNLTKNNPILKKKGREMDSFNNQGIALRDRPARVKEIKPQGIYCPQAQGGRQTFR